MTNDPGRGPAAGGAALRDLVSGVVPAPDAAPARAVPDRVAGLRVIRTLARDERADVVLLHTGHETPVVAKLFDAGVRAAADHELAALDRAASPHTVEILDVEVDADGRLAMVMPRLPRGSVGAWLADRDGIAAGEAATLLAPIAQTLESMHASGVAHGRLASGRVLLSAAGSPTLIGFGTAALFEQGVPEVVRESVVQVRADRASLRALVGAVLPRVRGMASDRAAGLLARLPEVADFELETFLVSELFSFTAGSALHTAARVVDAERAPGRVVPPAPPGRRALRSAAVPARSSRVLAAFEEGPMATARRAATAAWTRAPRSRRRLVAALGAAAATVILAAILVPGADSGAADPGPRASSQSGGGGVAESSMPGASDPPKAGAESLSESSSPTDSPVPDRPDEDAAVDEAAVDADAAGAVEGADPIAALTVLLRTRERALRDLDRTGLALVDEPGSAAVAADDAVLSAVRSGRDAGTIAAGGFAPVELHRMGDAVVVDLGPDADPASALLVRTEAGWRVRDWFPPEGSG